jgi:hypothetical protein
MTDVEGRPSRMHERLAFDRMVFVLVSVTIIAVLVEAGIVRVSGFVGVRDLSFEITSFVGLAILCIVSQLIILKYVRNKVGESLPPRSHMNTDIMNKAIVAIQLGIIALLTVAILEVLFAFSYHTLILRAVITISFLTAAGFTAILSWQFIIWIKSDRNRLTVTYLSASLFVSLSAIAGVLYFLDQLFYRPDIIYPKTYGDFVTHVAVGNSLLLYIYAITSAVAFVLLWIGTVFLLQGHRKKLGRWKYWIIMFIPLLFFLSQFQPMVLNFLLSYVSNDLLLFSLVYVIMTDASRPIGGVLFGLAFILVARKLQNREVRGYMVISGIGFLLLLVSYGAQALITAPFPPLGLLSGSYFGLASYLIFIGLYSSAVSISQDSRLRDSIRKSIESEVRFLGSIGEAEMYHRIINKVLTTSQKISKIMPEETGVHISLSDEEIKEYIKEVLSETHNKPQTDT